MFTERSMAPGATIQRVIRSNTAWLVASSLLVAGVFSGIGIYQHLTFRTYAHDLGIFDQAIWHLSRFEAPASTIRQVTIDNLFGDHFHPIIILLVPFYWLGLPAWILPLIQGVLFAATVPLIFMLARKSGMQSVAAHLFAVALGLSPVFWLAARFDFHEVAFAPVLFLGLALALAYRRWVAVGILVVCILATKETLGAYLAAFGAGYLLLKKWRVGIVLAAVGLGGFLITTRVIVPALSNGVGYAHWRQYESVASSPLRLLGYAIKHPKGYLTRLVDDPEKRRTARATFGSFGFLPIFAVPYWPAFLLTFSERFLTSNTGVWMWQFQYGLTGVPFLTLGSIWVMRRIQRWKPRLVLPAVLVVGVSLFVTGLLSKSFDLAQKPSSVERQRWADALRSIPPSSSVSAQNVFVPHLSRRHTIYQFPRVREADWIIIDPASPAWPLDPYAVRARQETLMNSGDWQVVYAKSSTTVFKRIRNNATLPVVPGWE